MSRHQLKNRRAVHLLREHTTHLLHACDCILYTILRRVNGDISVLFVTFDGDRLRGNPTNQSVATIGAAIAVYFLLEDMPRETGRLIAEAEQVAVRCTFVGSGSQSGRPTGAPHAPHRHGCHPRETLTGTFVPFECDPARF